MVFLLRQHELTQTIAKQISKERIFLNGDIDS